MIRVPTPAACAREVIAGALPPSDLLTYQIHIERPSMAALDALELAGETRALRTSGVRRQSKAVVALLGRRNDKFPSCDPALDSMSWPRGVKRCTPGCGWPGAHRPGAGMVRARGFQRWRLGPRRRASSRSRKPS